MKKEADKLVTLLDQMIKDCGKTRADVEGLEPNHADYATEITIWFRDGTNAILTVEHYNAY